MSNVLAIGDMLSKNLDIPDTPWRKIMEGTCDDYAAEHRRRLLPIFHGELLLLEDVRETSSQGSSWDVLYSAHGGLNKTALVANSVGPPDFHRLEMLLQSISEASFSGTSSGRRVRCGAFTSVEPRSLVLHVAQPPARHAALPEAERRHAMQQRQHGRHGVSKILPKVTTRQVSHARSIGSVAVCSRHSYTGWRYRVYMVGDTPESGFGTGPLKRYQREFRRTCCFPPSDGPTMLLRTRCSGGNWHSESTYAHRRSSKRQASRPRHTIERRQSISAVTGLSSCEQRAELRFVLATETLDAPKTAELARDR
ncbi:hypothetical protein MTO96_034670 [Rhipicephalus appendiculatus]